MSQFIIDMGSGNTCKNDIGKVREMIDAVASVDTGKHEVIFKWQLFKDAPPNTPLDWEVFGWAYAYARRVGYETTASVFDVESREFLLGYGGPFIKIPCRPKLYHLIRDVKARFVVSFLHNHILPVDANDWLACVPKYPAMLEDYTAAFGHHALHRGISDHTIGWDLYNDYTPVRIEKHFCLKHDKRNPDAGAFAVTPEELAEVL